jgi:ribosome-binding protein aMBF1 (putative translation factor)
MVTEWGGEGRLALISIETAEANGAYSCRRLGEEVAKQEKQAHSNQREEVMRRR